MNKGHFYLTLFSGIAIGVTAATPHVWVAFAGIAATMALAVLLYLWMDYCDRDRPRALSHPNGTK